MSRPKNSVLLWLKVESGASNFWARFRIYRSNSCLCCSNLVWPSGRGLSSHRLAVILFLMRPQMKTKSPRRSTITVILGEQPTSLTLMGCAGLFTEWLGSFQIWCPQKFRIFWLPLALSAFGSDLYHKIHATSLTTTAFPWPPSPSDTDIISASSLSCLFPIPFPSEFPRVTEISRYHGGGWSK